MPEHIGVAKTDALVAIVTGNPDRVPVIASFFDDGCVIASRRGFLCYSCLYQSTPLLVISSGIGAPSMAIVAEELIDLGIRLIIRLGTCGAIQPGVHVGDLVIPTGAIREEGTSLQYVDVRFPAVPDYCVLRALCSGARELSVTHHIGIIHCKDAYYSESPHKLIDSELQKQRWNEWRAAGAIATEMESSALFVIGSLRRILTGSILINVGKSSDPEVFERSLGTSVRVVKGAINELANSLLLSMTSSVEESPQGTVSYLSNRVEH